MIKILLLYDIEGWATHSSVIATAKYLERTKLGKFKTTIKKANNSKSFLSNFDIVFSTLYYALKDSHHVKSITQISSYSYWIRKNWKENWEKKLQQWKYVVAKNKDIYNKLKPEDHSKITLLYHIIDKEQFYPLKNTRKNFDNNLRVGFAGHAKPNKGYDIIKKSCINSGCEFVSATFDKRIPHKDMIKFYNSLDCYVSMSKLDAGPRTAMEAGLCGIPVITNKMGQIQEMIVDGVNGIISERNVESLTKKLREIKSNRELLEPIRERVRDDFVKDWCDKVGEEWCKFFIGVNDG